MEEDKIKKMTSAYANKSFIGILVGHRVWLEMRMAAAVVKTAAVILLETVMVHKRRNSTYGRYGI